MLEVAAALRRAGAEHVSMDEGWCEARAREATDELDRETYEEGVPGIAWREGVDAGAMGRVAVAVELAGNVVLFFDGDGGYLGLSTTYVDETRFYPKGEDIGG